MNKKFATFLFALSIGVTAAPAFASCYSSCAVAWRACVASGIDRAECDLERTICQGDCRPSNDPA